VSTQIEFHNKQQAITGNKMIELDADIAEIFHMSTSVSGKPSTLSMILSDLSFFFLTIAQKGVGAHLLKPGAKRRRTKQQIQDDKVKAAKLQLEIENKVAAYDSMQAKVEVAEAQSQETSNVKSQL